MNKNDIERIAVNKLDYELTKTKILQGYVNTNDKTPYFDGPIYVYKDEQKENSKDPNNFWESLMYKSKDEALKK